MSVHRKRSSTLEHSASFDAASERLVVLRHTRSVVQKEVDKFLSAKVNPFNKYKYFVLILAPFISVWIAGYWPSMYWRWHLCQYAVVLPVQLYRWTKLKKLLFFSEFCWVTNFSIMIYLMICLVGPDALPEEVRGVLFRMVFAIASGPLGLSVVLTQNSFVPQSMDQTSLLLIHLQPLVTVHTLKYHGDSSVFPSSSDIDLWRYCMPTFIMVSGHMVLHTIFFLAFALHMPDRGHETAFNDLFTSENIYTTVLGQVGAGGPRLCGSQETLRFLAYEVVGTLGIFALVTATYPLYIVENHRIGLGIIFVFFIIALIQGASWTEYRVGRLTSEIDELIKMEEASMCSKGNDSYENFVPSASTVGIATPASPSSDGPIRSDSQISAGFLEDDGNEAMTTPFKS